MKGHSHRGRQKKYDICGIGEALLVLGIIRARWVDRPAVVSTLNFESDDGAVRVASVKQQFARSQPARVEVRQVTARSIVRRRVGKLLRPQNSVHIEPGTSRNEQR